MLISGGFLGCLLVVWAVWIFGLWGIWVYLCWKFCDFEFVWIFRFNWLLQFGYCCLLGDAMQLVF